MFYRLISIVGRGWASFAFLKMHLLKLSSILNLSYTSENKLLTKNQKNKNTCILLCTLLENSGRRHCKHDIANETGGAEITLLIKNCLKDRKERIHNKPMLNNPVM